MNLKKMEKYLRVNLLGPGPRLMKKEFTGRGLTEGEQRCLQRTTTVFSAAVTVSQSTLQSAYIR